MNRKKIYVTYTHVSLAGGGENRFAVMCETPEQATEVGMDLNSRANVKNVRINKCGRGIPKESSKIFFFSEYMQNAKKK